MTISITRKGIQHEIGRWQATLGFIGAVLAVCITAATPLSFYIRSEVRTVVAPLMAASEAKIVETAAVLDKSMVERDQAMRFERISQLNEIRAELNANGARLVRIESGIDRLVQMHLKEK